MNVGIGNGMGGGGRGSDGSEEKPDFLSSSRVMFKPRRAPHLLVIGSRGDPG